MGFNIASAGILTNVTPRRKPRIALTESAACAAASRVIRPTVRVSMVSLLAFLVGGCVSMPQAGVVGTEADVRDGGAIELYDRLDDVRMVSTGDGVRAMNYFVARGRGIPADYAGQVAALRSKDLLAADFDTPAERALDRGTLARFVASALDLPKGLTASVVGYNGRYALRELQFRGLIPTSSPNQTLTGPELIGILARAEAFEREATRPGPGRGPGIAPPTRENDARPPAEPVSPVPVAGRPLPGVELVSRSLDAMMLALADPPASPAATQAAGPAFVFDDVQSEVKVRPAGTKDKFVAATKGMQITADTDVRTSDTGTCTLLGPNGQKVTFAPYSKVTLRAKLAEAGMNKTNVDLQRGQAAMEIDTAVEGAGQQYDVRLQSPRNTLAIKGTRVALYDQQPFDTEARSFTGTAVFETPQGRRVAFGKRGGGLVTVTGRTPDPTGVALSSAVSDPSVRNARSDSEANLIANYFSRNTTIRFDRFSELPTIRGGSTPQSFADFQSFFTGGLDLGVRWTGDVNLNIQVVESPDDNGNGTGGPINRGRVIYPYGKLAAQGGASIPFDHRGGAKGGFEVANIGDPQKGHYGLLVENLSSSSTTAYFFAGLNGKSQTFYDPDFLTAVAAPQITVDANQSRQYDVYFDSKPQSAPIDTGDGSDGSGLIDVPAQKAAKANLVRPAGRPAKAAKPTPIGPVQPTPRAKRSGR